MRRDENKFYFDKSDMKFVKKFGIMRATEMLLDFEARNSTPFIYDTRQLAGFFHTNEKSFFKTLREAEDLYTDVKIPKKNGGFRVLNVPDDYLKYFQEIILHNILEKIPVSKYAKAYYKGATLYDNAKEHCGKKYLLKIDIEDFFGSISFEKVLSCVFNSSRFPRQIGFLLTKLCTYKAKLPQGAPTSPMISNIVMYSFDEAMGRWCEKHGITYTRYCDDLTFSSDKPLYLAFTKAQSMLSDAGFFLNEKKTHFITNASRQCVTGLTVNEKVSVPSDYKRKLRQEIYYVLKHGFRDAVCFAERKEYMDGENVFNYRYFCNLMGRINFVIQIEPDNKAFIEAGKELTDVMRNSEMIELR